MTTTTSYSNAGRFRPLYLSLLKRNAGYFGMVSALIFLFYPVQYALEIFQKLPDYKLERLATLQATGEPLINAYNLIGYGKSYTEVSVFFFSAIMIVMPLVLALMLNSYMHSKKAADVFHSLPIRRETLLYANAAVGMTMLTVPVVISNIAIALMMTVKFGWMPGLIGAQLIDMIGWLACALAIYAITAFVSVLSGTVFDTLTFSCMMLFSVPAVCGIYLALCASFLHGFSMNEETVANLLYFSPTFIMVARMANAEGSTMISAARDLLANNISIAVYLVLGVLLLVLAARLYHNRHSELAEMTGYVGPLPLATKLVGTLIGGILTGLLFYAMNDQSQLVYVLWAIIGGMVAYVILDVILCRGFKHLVKSLPIGAGMIAFAVITSAAIMNGGFGYETRVPDASKVASVSIGGLTTLNNTENGVFNMETGDWEWNRAVTLTDPKTIQLILDFHTDTVTRNMPENETALLDAGERQIYQWIKLDYQMKNGSRIQRSYSQFSNKTLEMLNVLQFTPEFITQSDQAFSTPVANISEWKVTNLFGSMTERMELTSDEAARLLEAIQADILARTAETITAQPVAWVTWTAKYELSDEARGGPPSSLRYVASNFNVLATDVNSLAFLRQKNLLASLEPDWSKCTAVGLSLNSNYARGDSGVYRRVFPENLILSQERANIENALRNREDQMKQREVDLAAGVITETTEAVPTKQYYWDSILLETPEEIAAMNDAIIGIGRQDQRVLHAIFFFEGSDNGLPVLVNYDALPEAVKATCRTMWGAGVEENMYNN